MAKEKTVSLPGGREITAVFYKPAGEVKGAVLVAPAMGVSQNYYAHFASWLSGEGYAVHTFDYFGIGRSLKGSMRKADVDISGWVSGDCNVMADIARLAAPGLPFYWIGHSLGGQVIGLLPGKERISKALMIASGSWYWRENSPELARKVWLLWYFMVPVALPVFGYFPGKKLGMVGDLPKKVMAQWRRWCLNPRYMIGVERGAAEQFSEFGAPLVSISFEDDEMMSARNIASLESFYTDAQKKIIRLAPQDVEAERIGHFGFFRREFKETLWSEYILPELL